jgi:hypothetical protein
MQKESLQVESMYTSNKQHIVNIDNIELHTTANVRSNVIKQVISPKPTLCILFKQKINMEKQRFFQFIVNDIERNYLN